MVNITYINITYINDCTVTYIHALHTPMGSRCIPRTAPSVNPHPVMSPDLHGPPAGPRRPGIMIFKCIEFLVQLKNKNSSY